jgi:hypothetical protein
MRNGHQNNNHKRMRGRHQHHNNRKNQNPLTRAYESNGPDVKIRGTAQTIAEKYIQLARDAQGSGDPVAAENYYQHAEHYFRLIAAAQEQFRQQNPQHFSQPQQGGQAEGNFEDSDDEFSSASASQQNEPYAREQPQPYMQQQQPREQQPRQQNFQPRQQHYNQQPQQAERAESGVTSGLPSFITGGQQPQPASADANAQPGGQEGDRFPLHRRRRRHRGNRPDFGQSQPEGTDEPQSAGE